ncbi:MAG: FkbM family methyltransferase [Planctomycetes bacterium]|jgi:FkbM family methyltransferase|nr:FkbM family methyltransferase [Planctomycetota bacterium]
MSHTLRDYADAHFAEIADRKQRETAAERRLVRLFFGDKTAGTYVEVGANDPVAFSQTHHLEEHGWSGLLIEPIPELCDALRAQRPASTVVQVACGKPADRGQAEFAVAADHQQSALKRDQLDFQTDTQRTITVEVVTLDDVLDQHPTPTGEPYDLVSIDVEGMQREVLEGFDLNRHRPRLLLIEDHLTDLRTHRHIKAKGYRLAKRTGLNNWYIPKGQPFTLASAGERFALWRKLYLRTWFRGLRFRLLRRIKGTG